MKKHLNKTGLALLSGVALAALSGCTTDELARPEGVTLRAGDAIAVNTVLQIVDPWTEGVEDTDLRVPADRGGEDSPAPLKPASTQ